MLNSTESRRDITARRIGATANEVLTLTGQKGKILAVVSDCIYLTGPGGQLIWLVKEFSPLHSRAVQLAEGWPRLLRDASFQVAGGKLVFPAGVSVDAARAPVWRPAVLAVEGCLPFGEVGENSQTLYSQLLKMRRTGFGWLLEPILALAEPGGLVSPPEFSDQVLRVAWPTIRAVAEASARQDLDSILGRVNELVGLGNGLTPSGDDFLGGLFFGLFALNQLYPAEMSVDLPRVEETLVSIANRTNIISSTILRDLARGRGPEPMHDLIHFLFTPATRQPALLAARALASIGHSTGWDLLAGMLVGLLWTWQPQSRASYR